MQGRAKAITFEEYRRNGGGGGRDPRGDEGILAPLFRKWAQSILDRKVQALETLGMLTPAQYVLRQDLMKEFDRVAQSTLAAQRVIREHSELPFVRFIV